MSKILIFAGTTEGHSLAKILNQHEIPFHMCVATEYGEKVLEEELTDKVTVGRLDAEQMMQMMKDQEAWIVVDATHPYAVIVSENIREACQKAGVEYLRLLRASEEYRAEELQDCIFVDSVDEAVDFLAEHEGKALLTTGSKELVKYTRVEDYQERFFARVLATPEVVLSCQLLGFEGKNLIAMQGPFTEEMNVAMLKMCGAKYLVTKEAGKAGGFAEKVSAARKAGAQLVLIRRPSKEEGSSLEEVVRRLCPEGVPELAENIEVISPVPRKITLLGIGMGAAGQLTWDGIQACQQADVIIGARRMLDALKTFGKLEYASYKSEEIIQYIHENPQYHRVVIALSGDVGFYSGAKKLWEGLDPKQIEVISGISSVVYFCGQLHKSWEDVHLVSLHGRSANLIAAVREHRKVFALVGGKDGVHEACQSLIDYGYGDISMWVGQDLSYENEKIWPGTPESLLDCPAEGLNVILLENDSADHYVVTHGIPDDAFIRDKVPMTKEEIRSISISKLQLRRDSVLYDVGAGTGSISIEAARQMTEGQVYAIEKKQEAVALIGQNCRKFGTSNVVVVEGLAPEALDDLPTPTHACIGGSSGNMDEILDHLREKNPAIRIVVNAIALETIGQVMDYLKKNPPVHEDIAQVSVAKSRVLGSYHMMTGLNPVMVAAFDYAETEK